MKRLILPAVFLASFVTICFAQDAAPQPDAQRVIRRVEHRLHITDRQRTQAKAILSAEAPKLSQLHQQIVAEHNEMAVASSDGVFNEAQTKAIAARYAQSNEEAIVEREKLRTEIMAILTPDQQKRVEELRARFGAAFDQHIETLGDNL